MKLGFSRQLNRKADEGAKHPDRNAQFEHINTKVVVAQMAPMISVDTKKKEMVGSYKNGGSEVPAAYRFWLTEKLRGGTDSVDDTTLEAREWERLSERRARNLLAAGNAQRAITELTSRAPQSYRPNSPLLADALRLQGDNHAALDVISIGTKVSDVGGGQIRSQASLSSRLISTRAITTMSTPIVCWSALRTVDPRSA